MEPEMHSFELNLLSFDREEEAPGVDIVRMHTDAGIIDCRLHPAEPEDAAVIWVGGAGGGLFGPAGGLYPRMAGTLAAEGIASLRLDYRHPNDLIACVLDTLIGVSYLQSLGYGRFILAGHSFGGAVVITAGAHTDVVVGVIGLSSQNAGTELTADLSPRAVLLLHGTDDRVLPDACSRDIYFRAKQPKQIELYPGCDHNLDECREDVDRDVSTWIQKVLKQTTNERSSNKGSPSNM